MIPNGNVSVASAIANGTGIKIMDRTSISQGIGRCRLEPARLNLAEDYARRGWTLTLVPRNEKAPREPHWDKRDPSPAEIERHLARGGNLGLMLGGRSGETVDIDLDSPESLALASLYLPATAAVFGRPSKPKSHRLYVALGAAYEAFADPLTGDMLLELRAQGRTGGAHQTLLPPSLADGERRGWHGAIIAPAVVDAAVLRTAVAWLAVGCLVMRYVGETAARDPRPDLPSLLWECDHALGRRAHDWLSLPHPDTPRRYPRRMREMSRDDLDFAAMVASIPNTFDWHEWNSVGMAIYAASSGSEDGFIAFDDLSAFAEIPATCGCRALAQLPPIATQPDRDRQAHCARARRGLASVRAEERFAMNWLDFVEDQAKAATENARAEGRRSQPNGADPEPREPMPPIDGADVKRWKGREPPDLVFTIEDLAPQGMVTLLTGQGGSGKTLLLQMAGTVVAAGTMAFLGKAVVVGRAASVFAEDPESVLHVRQPRINQILGIDYDRIAGRYFPQSYFGLPTQLWRKGGVTAFFDSLEGELKRIEALRLLTLDNAAVLFSGDENSRAEVTEFISALNGLADRLSIGIILSAHPSKTQDGTALRVSSGSTAWVNACRSVLELKPGDSSGNRDKGPSLVVVKANHAATGTTIQLEWRENLLVPVLSSTGLFGSIQRRATERVFLDLLDAATQQGRNVSDSKHAGNYAPKTFAGSPNSDGYSQKELAAAMERLFAAGELRMEQCGRKGDERRRMVRVSGKTAINGNAAVAAVPRPDHLSA
jgi:RecA-family ATPase